MRAMKLGSFVLASATLSTNILAAQQVRSRANARPVVAAVNSKAVAESAPASTDSMLVNRSPSKFRNEYDEGIGYNYSISAAQMARVPKGQVFAKYLHLLSAHRSQKSGGSKESTRNTGGAVNVGAIGHLSENLWLGISLFKGKEQAKLSRSSSKTTVDLESQQINTRMAYQLSSSLVAGLSLRMLSASSMIADQELSASATMWNASLMYIGDGFEVTIAQSPTVNVDEAGGKSDDKDSTETFEGGHMKIVSPGQLEVMAEFSLSPEFSLRTTANYVSQSRTDSNTKNQLYPSVGATVRLEGSRLDSDLMYIFDSSRNDAESKDSVGGLRASSTYFVDINKDTELSGGLSLLAREGGKKTKFKHHDLIASVGIAKKL